MIKKESDNEVGKNDFIDSVQLYYHDLKRYAPLSREEEKELLIRAKEGDIDARNKILTANLRFVFDTAKKYRGRGVDIADLISFGNKGMMKAMDKFDVSRDVKFFSYAVWWIRQHMMQAIEDCKLKDEKETSFDAIFDNSATNYDNVFYEDDDDSYGNDIQDDKLEPMEYDEECNQKKVVVEQLLAHLDDRERIVIQKYFGIEKDDDGHSLDEISKELNLCTERIRQIKVKAINEMRAKVFNIEEAEFLFR